MPEPKVPVPFEPWTDEAGRPGFLHGTRAVLRPGELLVPGRASNFGRPEAAFVWFTATLDAATWGAELARGEGPGRIYVVEPTGPYEDDPELTDRRFPGNPTRSFRSRAPLRVVHELPAWIGHPPEQLAAMRAHIEALAGAGEGAAPEEGAVGEPGGPGEAPPR